MLKNFDWDRWGWRIAAAITLVGLLWLMTKVTGGKNTEKEDDLWTFITFAIGIAVSFYFGMQSIKNAAANIVRPQARGAARRLINLGLGLQMFDEVLQRHREAAEEQAVSNRGAVPLEQVTLAYDNLSFHIEGQKRTVVDALEDWREFEPEIVNDLEPK